MHRAATSKLPKFITSLLAIFALIAGLLGAGFAPANAAASINGCTNSNSGSNAYNSCANSLSVTLDPSSTTDVETRTHTSEDVSRATMKWEGGTLTPDTGCAVRYSMTETSSPRLNANGNWSIAISSISGQIQTAATGSTAALIYQFNVTANYTCVSGGSVNSWSKTATFQLNLSGTTLYTVSFQNVVGGVGSGATGSFSSLAQATAGGTVSLPTDPALTGYTFGGWSATSGGTTAVSNSYTPTANTTLYAIWTAAPSSNNPPPAAEPEPPTRKVTICHRTHATTNPYVRITVDYNSVNKKSGHQGHDEIFAGEHVFKAGIYVRAKDKLWGDIIPADPSGLNRWQPLNWTTLGAQIYNGTVAGCPAYDPVAFYNAQREAGVPEAKLKKEMADIELELQEAAPGTKRVDPNTLKYSGNNPVVAEADNDKVTICHRTHATTNPYVRITVSTSSVTNPAGHYSHDEIYDGHHVFDSAVKYPNNQKLWGDIIPADPTGKNRWQPLNWTALGQSIFNGTTAGCGTQSIQETYNKLRESGLSKKEVLEELEKQKNVEEDPKDIDELTYKGSDPEVQKKEPKEPELPPGSSTPDQSLSGIIWLDLDKDGLKGPNEPYLPNVTLTLLPANAPAGTTGVQVKTDANGFYQFISLNPGDWKVVTTIPTDLLVTYDSAGLHEGEMSATLPVGGRAFTWAGLVGSSELIDNKTLETLLLNNPKALPLEEIPTWLRTRIAAILSPDKKPAVKTPNVKELAYTGGNELPWLAAGLLLTISGLVVRRLARTKRRNVQY